MYCQGSADNQSTFCLVCRVAFQYQYFLFFTAWCRMGKEFSAKGAMSWAPLCSTKSSAPFPNQYVADRHNSCLWTRDLTRWCSSLIITVLWRAQSAAFYQETVGLLKVLNRLARVILDIRLLLDEMLVPHTREQIGTQWKLREKKPNKTTNPTILRVA